MKKLLKTKKLEVKTETVRNLTDKQLDYVAGGITSVVNASNTNDNTARCNALKV